jgi:hypothetical protein
MMVSKVSVAEFPKQSDWVGRVVKILFKDASWCYGILARDDLEEPFHTFLRLFDGRVVTAEEVWWTPAPEEEAERRNAGAKLGIPRPNPPSPAVFEVRKHMDEFGFGSPDAVADTPAVDPSMPKS